MILQEPPPAARCNMAGIFIIGEAPLAGRWARALAQAGDARLLHPGPSGEPWAPSGDIAPFLEQPAVEAVILADPLADAYGLARRALLAGKHVLCGGPFLLGTGQTAMLTSLAQRRNLVLAFRDERAHQPAFAFLARMVGDGDALWPPLYIRCLRTASPSAADGRQVDALAATEIAAILRLAGDPQAVAATGCRGRRGGPLEAAFITLSYGSGLTALAIVSAAEASPTAELTVVADSRTMTLEEHDQRATLRVAPCTHVLNSSRTAPSESRTETANGHALAQGAPTDPFEEQARIFIEGVASGGASIGNVSLWHRVALVLETARESMTLGGAPVAPPRWPSRAGHEKAPPLKVIEGGGSNRAAARRRPALTLVTS
jgi:predicted dehydrogenase